MGMDTLRQLHDALVCGDTCTALSIIDGNVTLLQRDLLKSEFDPHRLRIRELAFLNNRAVWRRLEECIPTTVLAAMMCYSNKSIAHLAIERCMVDHLSDDLLFQCMSHRNGNNDTPLQHAKRRKQMGTIVRISSLGLYQ